MLAHYHTLKSGEFRADEVRNTAGGCCGRQRFESLDVYGFARPATGRNLTANVSRLTGTVRTHQSVQTGGE